MIKWWFFYVLCVEQLVFYKRIWLVINLKSTSFDFKFSGKVVKVPIKWIGKSSTETDSSETWLDPNNWELQKCNEKWSAGEASDSGESFPLTMIKERYTVQLRRDIRYFLIGHRVISTYFFQSIISYSVLQAIVR